MRATKFLSWVSFGVIVAVTLAAGAFLIPMTIIGTNIDKYEGEQRVFAGHALLEAQRFTGGSLEPVIITGRKVISVIQLEDIMQDGCPATSGDDYEYRTEREYEATVQTYTVFGLPYKAMRIGCDQTNILKS